MNLAEEKAALLAQADQLKKRAASLAEHDVTEDLAKDCVQTAGREKWWGELSIEEKIERTRVMVKALQQEWNHFNEIVANMTRAMEALRHDLVAHRHGASAGEVLMPASNEKTMWYERNARLALDRGAIGRAGTPPVGGCEACAPNPNEVYF